LNGITTHSLDVIKAALEHARSLSEVPEPANNGWSKCTVDPSRMLTAFPPLSLQDGFQLRAYQYFENGNGNAVVYAMPEGAPFPDPENCPRVQDEFLEPPVPPGAVDDVRSVIRGDGSPWSYMCASLFARELAEFGAMWHGSSWGTHHLLGCNPFALTESDRQRVDRHGGPDAPLSSSNETQWTWLEAKPKEWRPSVTMANAGVTVTFHTFSGLGYERICRHEDVYGATGYCFENTYTELAHGPAGYVF